MTGKDLILYILQNNLEDQPVFQDGKFIGFLTEEEVAAKLNVGVATIRVWVAYKWLDAVWIGGRFYIPANFTPPAIFNL